MRSPLDLNDKSSPDMQNIALVRVRELADLIIHFAPKQPLKEFITWYTELRQINEKYPENTELQDSLAQVLSRSVRMFGERKSFADMFSILDDYEKLIEQSNNSEIICEYYAEALAAAISYLRGTWDAEGTNTLMTRLHLLVKEHAENKVILLSYARGYMNAINRFCTDRHNFICEKLIFEFRMIANKHRDLVEIQIDFAQALVCLIGTYARELKLRELQDTLDELNKIAGRFPDNEDIKLLATRAKILSSLAYNKKE